MTSENLTNNQSMVLDALRLIALTKNPGEPISIEELTAHLKADPRINFVEDDS